MFQSETPVYIYICSEHAVVLNALIYYYDENVIGSRRYVSEFSWHLKIISDFEVKAWGRI